MKNRAISYITLLLLAAMVTNSCGGDAPAADTTASDAGETTPAETEYVDPFQDDLPDDLDFGGREFHILTYLGANLPVDARSWPGYMMVEEENGDNYALNALQPMILAQEDAFVQKYVENKLLRDDGSIEMYKLLTATAAYETSRYIDLSGGLIYNFKPIGNLISKGSADLASEWASVKEAVTSAYADFFAKQK